MIEVLIRRMPMLDLYPILMEDEATVCQLKEKIRDQLHIEINSQLLFHNGHYLQNRTLLADKNMHGEVIDLAISSPLNSDDDWISVSSEESLSSGGGRSVAPVPVRLKKITLLIHDIRGLLEFLGDIKNVTESGTIVITTDYTKNVKHLIQYIRDSLGSLRDLMNVTEVLPGPGDKSEEVDDSAPSVPTSDCIVKVADSAADCNASDRNSPSLAQLNDDLARVQLEFEPYLSRYGVLFRSVCDGGAPGYTPEQKEKVKEMVNLIGTVCHRISEAYLTIIETDFALDNSNVSLLSQDLESPFQGGTVVMTEATRTDRINYINSLIHGIRDSLGSLREMNNFIEENSESSRDSSPDVLKIPAVQEVHPGPGDKSEEVYDSSPSVPTSDCTERVVEKAAGRTSLHQRFSRDLHLMVEDFAIYRSSYKDLLRAVSAGEDPGYMPEELEKVKEMIDLIGTVSHRLSNAYVSIIDNDFAVDNSEVSLLPQDHESPFQGGTVITTEATAIDGINNIECLIREIRDLLDSLLDLANSSEVYSDVIFSLGTRTPEHSDDKRQFSYSLSEYDFVENTTVDILTPPSSGNDSDDMTSTCSSSDEDIPLSDDDYFKKGGDS